MGRNGMGKTTLMKSLMGIIPATRGSIKVGETDITALKSYERVADGIAYVPQGRMVFSTMTVKENIEPGLSATGASEIPGDIYELFPVLLEMKRPPRPATSPAASSSSWRSPGRSPPSRRCCCSTSRLKAFSPRSSRRWRER